jgi:hypothetical protein
MIIMSLCFWVASKRNCFPILCLFICLFVYFSSSGANVGSEGGGEEEEKAHKLCCFWVSG